MNKKLILILLISIWTFTEVQSQDLPFIDVPLKMTAAKVSPPEPNGTSDYFAEPNGFLPECQKDNIITFLPDGRVLIQENDYKCNPYDKDAVIRGKWSASGKYFYWDNTAWEIYSMSETKLQFIDKATRNGVTYTMIITYKRDEAEYWKREKINQQDQEKLDNYLEEQQNKDFDYAQENPTDFERLENFVVNQFKRHALEEPQNNDWQGEYQVKVSTDRNGFAGVEMTTISGVEPPEYIEDKVNQYKISALQDSLYFQQRPPEVYYRASEASFNVSADYSQEKISLKKKGGKLKFKRGFPNTVAESNIRDYLAEEKSGKYELLYKDVKINEKTDFQINTLDSRSTVGNSILTTILIVVGVGAAGLLAYLLYMFSPEEEQ